MILHAQIHQHKMNIHPTAIISDKAKLDKKVTIGPFSVIEGDVKIKEGSIIKNNVLIKGPCEIGSNNIIYQFSSIGEDTPDLKFNGEKTKLIIGDRNIFREGVTVHRGTIQDKGVTQIGCDNLFMAYTHIAHDCIVGNKNIFANNASLAGHVIVGNNVNLGGYTLVHQFCSIGDYAFSGMGTHISMDVPAFVKVASMPTKLSGLNILGMKRNDIDSESIKILKKAYRIVFKNKNKLKDAINEIEELAKNEPNEYLKIFIESIKSSKRGITR